MDLAIAYFRKSWEKVIDVSKRASNDIFCRRGVEELRVEVKGTTRDGGKVLFTNNEVEEASHPGYALFLVSGIALEHSGESMQGMGVIVGCSIRGIKMNTHRFHYHTLVN